MLLTSWQQPPSGLFFGAKRDLPAADGAVQDGSNSSVKVVFVHVVIIRFGEGWFALADDVGNELLEVGSKLKAFLS